MNTQSSSRRDFLRTAAAVAALAALPASAAAPRKRNHKLGFDNFAVRGMKWNARQLIDYSEKLGCDSLFITDFGPFEGKHDDASLGEVRKYAAAKGITIELGSWSICPTSKSFKKDWGTAEEHLALGLRMSKAIGSRAFRVTLGNQQDRSTEGGIEARMADTVQVLKSQRSRAMDAGVKVAVENHAGDMQAWELQQLVEAAGKDYVGVNFDSGNAAWTLEDPHASLETLAPYILTTSLRDDMVWESANGVTVQWTAMGEGCLDLPAFFDVFEKRCPGVAVHIETISGFAREFPIWKQDIWKTFPKAKASDLARFIALAKRGKRIEPFKAPAGVDKTKADQDYQRGEVERSIKYCKEVLGLGLRA
jgi:3-oxoisoapionate decarboxylase